MTDPQPAATDPGAYRYQGDAGLIRFALGTNGARGGIGGWVTAPSMPWGLGWPSRAVAMSSPVLVVYALISMDATADS